MKITSAEQLAIYLKDVRKKEKLAQGQLAEKVGLRQETISKFENSPAKTQIDTLFKLLSAMNMELHVEKRGEKPSTQQWKEEW
ncbi:helix-turn-helix domain-containing protein [Enterobacter sp. Bisph1]|uniref:helix-turn-helix domain-containing protein n=1 Tax=Enterobacter sp. Bisph1 TaxID=1274399 RepID=UPI00057C28EB|nr:helix-turn-helix domain-containing protein [Enterobacter sp. Bisph1]